LDDVLGAARPTRDAGARGLMGAAADLARLRPGPSPAAREAMRSLRDGDDREAARLRRPREYDHGPADRRRRLRAGVKERVVLGTAALMRAAVEQATWHAAHRVAFGSLLNEQPLMQNVLADLCVESEAATVTALHLAAAYGDPAQAPFRRIATAIAKYWICKR